MKNMTWSTVVNKEKDSDICGGTAREEEGNITVKPNAWRIFTHLARIAGQASRFFTGIHPRQGRKKKTTLLPLHHSNQSPREVHATEFRAFPPKRAAFSREYGSKRSGGKSGLAQITKDP
jgi:hypothetical protein